MNKSVIDTHVHVWDLDRASYSWLDNEEPLLQRTYTIDEIAEERLSQGIVKGILVQAANNAEDSQLMFNVAAKTDWIAGVVAWLPLEDPALTEKILTEKLLPNTYFKGVRHLIHNEADCQWLLKKEVLQSLQILQHYHVPYEVVGILPEHIETAINVAKKIPALPLVLDHLNQPPVDQKERFGKWGALVKTIAQHPNVYAKISGLNICASFDHKKQRAESDLAPYLQFALEQFGDNRCFCGSDWPMCLKTGSYSETWQHYYHLLEELLSESSRQKILYDNAMRFYQL